jgi:hypothetical protein
MNANKLEQLLTIRDSLTDLVLGSAGHTDRKLASEACIGKPDTNTKLRDLAIKAQKQYLKAHKPVPKHVLAMLKATEQRPKSDVIKKLMHWKPLPILVLAASVVVGVTMAAPLIEIIRRKVVEFTGPGGSTNDTLRSAEKTRNLQVLTQQTPDLMSILHPLLSYPSFAPPGPQNTHVLSFGFGDASSCSCKGNAGEPVLFGHQPPAKAESKRESPPDGTTRAATATGSSEQVGLASASFGLLLFSAIPLIGLCASRANQKRHSRLGGRRGWARI